MAPVGVADADHLKLGFGRNCHCDANQTAADQQAVGLSAALYRRGVDTVIAMGAVIGAKDRIQALRLFKSLGDVRG